MPPAQRFKLVINDDCQMVKRLPGLGRWTVIPLPAQARASMSIFKAVA